LLRLDEEMSRAPVPAVDPATKARLFQQLDPRGLAAPGSSTPAPPRGHRRRVNWLIFTSAVAALFLGLILGWMLFGPREPPPPEGPSLPSPSFRAGPVSDRLMGRLVEHHLELAGTLEPAEQLALLSRMADDLRGEALRLARQASPEELPLVTHLYERVLREGVAPRAWALPAGQRQQLLPPLARHLRQTESEVEQAAKESPLLIADLLRPMGAAARDVSGLLLADQEPIPPPERGRSLLTGDGLGTSHTVLVALVAQSLLLAGESDALRRAYYCNDVADHLALAVQMASARGDTEQATRLGKYLGDIMDRGVSGNLNRVRVEEPDDPRLAELARVIQRAARAVEALEKDLAINPSHTQASRYGHAKDLERALKELEKALREATREKKDGPKKSPKEKDGPKKPPPKEKDGPGKPPKDK
jgi:tetratricopeptide (TPR) repeat protein